ncbi:MAG: YlxM family DNA-binding protein [Bacillota bacterium]
MDKRWRMSMLLDTYGELLTRRQRAILKHYYEDDFSLSEIAENEGISRAGVADIVKRGERALEKYESRLGLVQRFVSERRELERLHAMLSVAEREHRPDIVTEARQIVLDILKGD